MSQSPQKRETESSPARESSRQLSQHDPDAAARHRPPVLLIIIVLVLVAGVVILHLTGVLGPGSH